MSSWSPAELAALGDAAEVEISTPREGGGFTRPHPIWAVRVGHELFIRSWRGSTGRWYARATTTGIAHLRAAGVDRDVTVEPADPALEAAISHEYVRKYTPFGDVYVRPMIERTAVEATLRVRPT